METRWKMILSPQPVLGSIFNLQNDAQPEEFRAKVVFTYWF